MASTKTKKDITEEDYAYLYATYRELQKEHDIFIDKYMSLTERHQAVIDILQGKEELKVEEDK